MGYNHLTALFRQIIDEEQKGNLARRNQLVIEAFHYARFYNIETDIHCDPSGRYYPVIIFQLPEGQVSWSIPPRYLERDYCSIEERQKRVEAYIKNNPCTDPQMQYLKYADITDVPF